MRYENIARGSFIDRPNRFVAHVETGEKNKLIRQDEEHTQETRFNILGKVGRVLFVVCVFREENIIRLISARIANTHERARYEYGEDEY